VLTQAVEISASVRNPRGAGHSRGNSTPFSLDHGAQNRQGSICGALLLRLVVFVAGLRGAQLVAPLDGQCLDGHRLDGSFAAFLVPHDLRRLNLSATVSVAATACDNFRVCANLPPNWVAKW
jgi:hypothetical protein